MVTCYRHEQWQYCVDFNGTQVLVTFGILWHFNWLKCKIYATYVNQIRLSPSVNVRVVWCRANRSGRSKWNIFNSCTFPLEKNRFFVFIKWRVLTWWGWFDSWMCGSKSLIHSKWLKKMYVMSSSLWSQNRKIPFKFQHHFRRRKGESSGGPSISRPLFWAPLLLHTMYP